MPIRLVAFDNDGTLHPAKGVWEYLQQPLGLFDGEGERLLREHLRGELPYADLVRRSIARWEGRAVAEFRGVIDRLPLRTGTLETLGALREQGIRVVVFSSGVQWWADAWRERFGVIFDHYRANVAVADGEDRCTGEAEIHVTDDAPETNKGTLLRQIQDAWGIGRAETLAVGDGKGDIHMFRQAGVSFCVSPSEGVCEATTDGELADGDLRGILPRVQ